MLAAVRQFVDGFNKGDEKIMAGSCADEVSIIDEFPPHEWHGAGACATWSKAYDADAKKNGITDGVVVLGHRRTSTSRTTAPMSWDLPTTRTSGRAHR